MEAKSLVKHGQPRQRRSQPFLCPSSRQKIDFSDVSSIQHPLHPVPLRALPGNFRQEPAGV